MSATSVTAIYQRGGGPSTRLGGSARYVPRCSSPMSFLARVPYSLALLATTAGLFLIFNLAGASAAAVVGGPTLASGGRIGAAAADSDFALNFTQVVDHFNSLDARTFHQRYWENQRWWKVPTQAQAHPMAILRINSFHYDGDWNTSTIATWAKELGAIVFDLEPRYAGKSYPLPDVRTEDLRFYSIEQNVADVVSFISNKSALLPNNTRWVVMGELFDGAFATWVRAKPRVAFGVVAVSPHLLAVEGYPDYDLAYQAAIGSKCSKVIHDLLETVSWTLDNKTANEAYQKQCKSSVTLPNPEFMYVVSTILFGNMDSNYATLCSTFEKVKDKDNTTRLDALAEFIVAINEEYDMEFTDWDFALDTGGDMSDTGAGFRPTYYLKCTQLGQFETPAKSGYSLVPAERTVEWYLSVCHKLFPNLTADGPNVAQVNTNFGGRVPEGCNMAFVVSPNDPYSTLGPDPVLVPSKTKASGNKIIQIDCASPQVGLSLFSPATKADAPCLTKARAQVFQTLQAWQTQPDTCPTVPSGGGGGGGGEGHGDGDMALVGVFSAVGGIILGVAITGVIFFYLSRKIIQRWKASAYTHVN